MVNFKELMNKPPMTDKERDQLYQDWYDNLSESEKKILDKERSKW